MGISDWANNGDTQALSQAEIEQGFQCGAADPKVFNWIFQQMVALLPPPGTADGQVIKWDTATSTWIIGVDNLGDSFPPGITAGQVIEWDGSNWIAGFPDDEIPDGTSAGQVLEWDGSNWIAGTDDVGSGGTNLPDGTSTGQVIKWNGSSWVLGNDNDTDNELPSGASTGQVLKWNGSNWVAGTDDDNQTTIDDHENRINNLETNTFNSTDPVNDGTASVNINTNVATITVPHPGVYTIILDFQVGLVPNSNVVEGFVATTGNLVYTTKSQQTDGNNDPATPTVSAVTQIA